MKQFITAARVRAILANARTEKDAADILRAHHIKYGYSTSGGVLHIRIPARSGPLRVYRTACKSAPLVVAPAAPVPYFFAPALRSAAPVCPLRW